MNKLPKALALSVAIALTGCAEDDPQQFIAEGNALFEKGGLKEAGVQFKNALQINPELSEAYYGLAKLSEKESDWVGMHRNLQEVVRLDPNNLDARVKLGTLLIEQLEKAKEQVSSALKLDPENNGAILLDGMIQYKEEHYKEAMQQVDRVLAKESMNTKAIWLKASILLHEKQNAEAFALINRGLEREPGNLRLGMLKVQIHKTEKKFDEVIKDYEVLIAANPDDKGLYLAMANNLDRFDKPKRVEMILRQAMEKFPEDIDLKEALLDYMKLRRNFKLMESQLKDFISTQPEELQFKERLVDLYREQKRNDEAKTLLHEIITAEPEGESGADAKIQLAEMALAAKDKQTAENLINEVLTIDSGNPRGLLFRAGFKLERKDADGVVSDLRIVLRDQPESTQAMVVMALAYLQKGESEVAESFLRKALNIKPDDMSAIMPLSTVLLKRGDYTRAEELFTKAIAAKPNNLVVREFLVKLRVSQKDWKGAEAAVYELEKKPKGVLVARMLKGMLAEQQKQWDKAIQIYSDILTKQANANRVLNLLAKAYEQAGRGADYRSFLEGFVVQHPGNAGALNELGRIYGLERQWSKAESILQQALQIESVRLVSYKLMAGVLEQQGKDERVVDLYQSGLVKMPGHPLLMLELAKYYARTQQLDKAINTYETLLLKQPKFAEATNNLADLLLNNSTKPEDLNRALILTEQFKDMSNPYFLDSYGWALFRTGDMEKALAVLTKVVKMLPNNSITYYHLGEVLYVTGRHSDSRVALEKSLALAKNSNGFSGVGRVRQLLKEINNQGVAKGRG